MIDVNRNKSVTKLPLFLKDKNTLIVNFNEVEVSVEDGDGKQADIYSYCQVFIKFSGKMSRDEMIEELIKAKYATYGSELAAINSGDVDKIKEHQEWRNLCKGVADEIIEELF